MPKIKILIACDSSLSLMGLRGLLSNEKDFLIVKETTTLDDTFFWYEKENPDILLLCSHLLIDNGSDIVAKIKEKNNDAKIVVFNNSFSRDRQILLIRKGIVGIIKSDCSQQTLIKALRKIYAGEYWFRRDLIPSLIDTGVHFDKVRKTENSKIGNGKINLTKRELEVLSYVAAGYKNHDISSKLYVSGSTVKTHINSIYKKLQVNDRLQATFYAIKNNILPK